MTRPRSGEWLSAYVAVVAAAYTGALLFHAARDGFFVGDDYSTFLLGAREPFWRALWEPLGSQIVPLHRALTLLSWRVAPMNFYVALFILAAFHAVGIFYLFRILDEHRRSRLNVALVAAYATNIFLGFNLTWYTSGMTRFPYIAFTLIGVHEYLAYCRTGKRAHAFAVVGSYVAALGFYSKGILFPLYCAGAMLTRDGLEREERRDARVRKWALLVPLCIASAVYVPVARGMLAIYARQVNTQASVVLPFLKDGWCVFACGLLDVVYGLKSTTPWFVLLLFLAGGAYAVYRAPRSVIPLSIFALLVTVNLLVIAVSNRTVFWGRLMAFEPRHYFELGFLFTLFVGFALHRVLDAAPPYVVRGASVRAMLSVAFAAAFTAHAAVSYVRYRAVDALGEDERRARRFMLNLIADLRTLRVAEHPETTFVDGATPRYLDQMDVTFNRYSQLFDAMAVNVTFRAPGRAAYEVADDGHVIAGPPPRARRRRF